MGRSKSAFFSPVIPQVSSFAFLSFVPALRSVAMSITGNKTEAVFEHENITDSTDVGDAPVKFGQYAKIVERKAMQA